ncbi:DUF2512 family protein [Brevibacillus porteri]|uniref:DUF2512 family protein n=1 Tax=Brevibacillus porteri TaxID=2126350 RepID=A0ABX5FH54_9BACL|nr:DUF2512 family protein [Brevibacillus porteri]MED1797522.1 DUF2512 family protein [Brevibacillus porteri]MED2130738.1 DUF2512 family protein [Brevibacillus porteri]MED2745001.1 DUF2512 family protein [Brevibacillus porteri]MED2815905.1 DUF2512 family protein [Brevibacillus porteri]MED2895048.1 DUF2512 family protein [Brevibacillus porteri]
MSRFLMKAAVTGMIVAICLWWFANATWASAILTALGLTVIAYLIGDQLILRATNNITATIADAVIAGFYLWFVARWMDWPLSFGELMITVALLGVAELVYHRFLGIYDNNRINKEPGK